MSGIVEMTKELLGLPITKEMDTLFTPQASDLVRRITEECNATHSIVEETIWDMRADDLLVILAQEYGSGISDARREMAARLIIPMINSKLEWEKDSERFLDGLQQEKQVVEMETDMEDGLEFL